MKKTYLFIFLFSLVFVFLVFLFAENMSHFRSLGLLGVFLINFFSSVTLFLPTPAIAAVVAGGIIYSPIVVALAASLGATLGDMIGFLLGLSGKELFLKNHKRGYVVLRDIFRKFGGVIIFLFALVPNPFFDGIGILSGVFSFSAYRFFLLLFLGRLVRNLFLAFLGSSIGG